MFWTSLGLVLPTTSKDTLHFDREKHDKAGSVDSFFLVACKWCKILAIFVRNVRIH